jgi:hypothetical protein
MMMVMRTVLLHLHAPQLQLVFNIACFHAGCSSIPLQLAHASESQSESDIRVNDLSQESRSDCQVFTPCFAGYLSGGRRWSTARHGGDHLTAAAARLRLAACSLSTLPHRRPGTSARLSRLRCGGSGA